MFGAPDQATLDTLALMADDPRVATDYDRFLAACEEVARHDQHRLVRVNAVRARLTDGNGDLTITPRRLSAFWNKATRQGGAMVKLTELEARDLGVLRWDPCEGSPSGNDGKPQPVRRWLGEL